MALTVPIPVFVQDAQPVAALRAEAVVELQCGPVTFANGTPLTADNAIFSAVGFLLFRTVAGTQTVWDEQRHDWVAPTPSPSSQPLFFQNDRWQARFMTIGQKTASNAKKFDAGATYAARCLFRGRDASGTEHAGTSPMSAAASWLALGARDRAGLATDPPEDLLQAREIRMHLKDAAFQERAYVRVKEVGGAYQILLFVAGGPTVELEPSGRIVLTPVPGQVVRIEGSLDVRDVLSVAGTPLAVP
jgi:hypothetical protein